MPKLAFCSCKIYASKCVKVTNLLMQPGPYIASTKESPIYNNAILVECKILTHKKQNVVCLLSKLINTGKQIYQPYAWYLYLLINSVNQKHDVFCSQQSLALTARDIAMGGKAVELKKMKDWVWALVEHFFKGEKNVYEYSQEMCPDQTVVLFFFSFFCLLGFQLSYS